MTRTAQPRVVDICAALNEPAGRVIAARLTTLVAASPEPITIRIKSNGGHLRAFYDIVRVVEAASKARRCHITTVASEASSGAAYLLVCGHSAQACSDAKLLFHGARYEVSEQRQLKREQALAVAIRLDVENRSVGRRLAQRVAPRLAARCVAAGRVDPRRVRDQPAAEVGRLIRLCAQKLVSPTARRILRDTLDRFPKIAACVSGRRPMGVAPGRHHASLGEAELFEAAIRYEIDTLESQTINPFVAAEMTMDYLLVRDILRAPHASVIDRVDAAWTERLTHDGARSHQTRFHRPARPYSLMLWSFAVTLCDRLLFGENSVPASDAYWLGLVDDVVEQVDVA
jgi:Clp protease